MKGIKVKLLIRRIKSIRVNTKLLIAFIFLFLMLPAITTFAPLRIEEVKAQTDWIVIERGFNFIRRQNVADPSLYSWESALCWIWDGTQYVPYIYSETADYYQIQSGLIGARIYKAGYAEFYDPQLSEVRLWEETWEVQYLSKQGWKVCDTYNPTFTVSQEAKNIIITATFTTDYPNAGQQVFTVKYIFREGSPLKHEVTFTSYSADSYDFRVVQKWAGIVGGRVKHDKGENVITSATIIDSSWFRFEKTDGSLSVFEDQWNMYYDEFGEILSDQNLKPVTIDVHAQGMKADFVFGDWTLANGESLVIDPDTATLDDPTEDAFIQKDGTNYDRQDTEFITMGYLTAVGPYTWRGYVEWDVSSITDGATITDTVFKYHGEKHQIDCHVHEMLGVQPSTENDDNAGNQAIFDEAGEGTVYVDPAGFPVVASGQQIDLGTSADTDLGNQLTSDWFAIGFQSDNEASTDESRIYSEQYVSADPKPTLYVTYTTNTAPTNGAGSITDRDDTDNLYSQKKWYTGSSSATDDDGFADIDYMEFRLKQSTTTRAIFRYDEDTDTFTCESGSDKWDLDTSGSSAEESGNTITVTWKFKPKFGATEEADLEIELYVVDDEPESDTDTAQSDYVDVVVTLTISDFASSPTEYVDPSTSVTFSGTVYYVNNPGSSTASTSYPPNAEFTKVVIHDSSHTNVGEDTSISSGAFSCSVTSPGTVGQYTYHPFIDMADTDYTDGDVSGITDTITSEQVKVISYSVADDRVNINDNVNIDVTLDYASDNADVTDGTVTINGYSATHQGLGVWRITRTSATVTSVTYNTVAASGNTRGITSINQNGQSKTVIWDRIKITGMGNDDDRRDVGTTGTFWATAVLEFDNHGLGSGDSLTISGISMTWVAGNSRFEGTDSKSTPQSVSYDAFTSGNEVTYGITAGTMNGYSTTIIWDRLEITSVAADDARINIGATFELRYQIRYDFDNVVFDNTKGSITGFTWDPTNSWWDKIVTGSSSVTSTNYDETYISITDSTYGLTVKQDVAGVDVITDRIRIDSLSAVDTRVDVDTQITFYATASLEFDSHALGSGDSFTLSGYAFSWDTGDSRFEATDTKTTVTSVTINAFDSGSEATYGITVGNINSQTVTGIWDRINFVSGYDFKAVDSHIDIGTAGIWYCKLELEFDHTELTSGTVTLNTGTMTYDAGDSRWEYSKTEMLPTQISRNIASVSGMQYGITSLNSAVTSDSQSIIWDRVQITQGGAGRTAVGKALTVWFTAEYDYDNTEFNGVCGTLYVNTTAMTWSAANSRWEKSYSFDTVGARTFTITSVTDDQYGLTEILDSAGTKTGVWDKDKLESFIYSGGTKSTIKVKVTSEYGTSLVGTSVTLHVYLDGELFESKAGTVDENSFLEVTLTKNFYQSGTLQFNVTDADGVCTFNTYEETLAVEASGFKATIDPSTTIAKGKEQTLTLSYKNIARIGETYIYLNDLWIRDKIYDADGNLKQTFDYDLILFNSSERNVLETHEETAIIELDHDGSYFHVLELYIRGSDRLIGSATSQIFSFVTGKEPPAPLAPSEEKYTLAVKLWDKMNMPAYNASVTVYNRFGAAIQKMTTNKYGEAQFKLSKGSYTLKMEELTKEIDLRQDETVEYTLTEYISPPLPEMVVPIGLNTVVVGVAGIGFVVGAVIAERKKKHWIIYIGLGILGIGMIFYALARLPTSFAVPAEFNIFGISMDRNIMILSAVGVVGIVSVAGLRFIANHRTKRKGKGRSIWGRR